MPKEWDPDDPALRATAPHELAGVMRWHRNKVPSQRIMRLLGLSGTKLVATLSKAAEQERAAVEAGRQIHDPLIPEQEDD